jgi:hypothetical protein
MRCSSLRRKIDITDNMGLIAIANSADPIEKLYGWGVLVAAASFCYAVGYVVYQRWLHPLAAFPGPFLASLTDLWQVHQFLTLKQPYRLTELHEKYGQFVRYGPDKLSITAEDAIPILYQKAGRLMPKTEFYDAYGSGIPNVFNMRDEAVSLEDVGLGRN